MNHNQNLALGWLRRPDKKRMIYEGGGPKGLGSGLFYIDYSNGESPTLSEREVKQLIEAGLIELKWKDSPEARCYVLKD